MKLAGIWDWLLLGDSIEPSSLSLESNWAPISSLRLERFNSGRTLKVGDMQVRYMRYMQVGDMYHKCSDFRSDLNPSIHCSLNTGYFDWHKYQKRLAWLNRVCLTWQSPEILCRSQLSAKQSLHNYMINIFVNISEWNDGYMEVYFRTYQHFINDLFKNFRQKLRLWNWK